MNPNTPEIRITELEKKVNDLTDMLSSILMNSNSTKISFKNDVQFSKVGKVGFFGKTPAGQQTTSITGATYVANAGIDTATFDGYTIGKVVAALRTLGLIT